MKRLALLLPVLFLFAVPAVAAADNTYTVDIDLPVWYNLPGDPHGPDSLETVTATLPFTDATCTVQDTGNNDSVRTGSDVQLVSTVDDVWFLDIERGTDVTTPGTDSSGGPDTFTVGADPSVTINVHFDYTFSADLHLEFTCQSTTTTTTTTSTTTTPPTSTEPPETTTTTEPGTTTTVTTAPPSTTSTTIPTTTTTSPNSTTTTSGNPTTTGPPDSRTVPPTISIDVTLTGDCQTGLTGLVVNNTDQTVVATTVTLTRPYDPPLDWGKQQLTPGRHSYRYLGQHFTQPDGIGLIFAGDYVFTVTLRDGTVYERTVTLTTDDPECKAPPVPEPPTTVTAPTTTDGPPVTLPPTTRPPELPRTGIPLVEIFVGAVLILFGGGVLLWASRDRSRG